MSSSPFITALETVLNGNDLTQDMAKQAFETLMSEDVDPCRIAAFLGALRTKGESVDELTGAALAVRAKAQMIAAPQASVDTAGTGGDGSHSYNISTAAAIVAASAGIPMAKHGNKAVSSKSGSADVLSALGVNIDLDPSAVEASLRDIGIGFLMATKYHRAMARVAPVRRALATRTIFNLLGPLANPAGTTRQVIGVFDPRWQKKLAEVAGRLGGTHIWVVYGAGGLDELSTLGPSTVVEWKNGEIHEFSIEPQDLGLSIADPADLLGGDASVNAAALLKVLQGEQNAYADITVLNAAAALLVGGKTTDLKEAVAMARDALTTGRALAKMQQWIAYGKPAK